MGLQRLVLTFKPDKAGVEIRALYRRREKPGPNPGTKARAREYEQKAMKLLEGGG